MYVISSGEFFEGHLLGVINIDYYLWDFWSEPGKLPEHAVYCVYWRWERRSAAFTELMEQVAIP